MYRIYIVQSTLTNLQLANVNTYYNPKDTRKNKNKYNVILKIGFLGQLGWQKVLMIDRAIAIERAIRKILTFVKH